MHITVHVKDFESLGLQLLVRIFVVAYYAIFVVWSFVNTLVLYRVALKSC